MKKAFCFFVFIFSIASSSQIDHKTNSYLTKAEELKYSNSDSSIYYYKKSIALYEKEKDTVNMIDNLYRMSELYGHVVDYGNAYDGYWNALLLADKSKDDVSKARIYQGLGWLYSFYDRDAEALEYFNNSLVLIKNNKTLNATNSLELLLQGYFSIVNLYRVKKDFPNAKIYLDSCNITQKRLDSRKIGYYVEAESGYLDAVNKNYNVGLNKLYKSASYFELKDPSYLIIINYLIGDVFRMKGDVSQSIVYFEKSLVLLSKYKSHFNYKLIIYDALSKLYALTGDYKKAYLYSTLDMKLNAQVFGKSSKNSKHLFEINDKYRLQKEKEKQILNKQRIIQLENEEKVWYLKSVLFTFVVLSLAFFGFLFIKEIRRKHKAEKQALAEKQEMELQKAKEILELKNKELTTSALQLIEKDEFIERLKSNLSDNKENVDVRTINKLLKTIQGSPSSNWKEFEARFTAVNQSFYTNLKDKYPDLGQTDLKICALIKLNFSSKDMASLLGISFESVHTSRYRLRKKFKLDRNDNLNEFISVI
ncbi:helix-turn-helix transcriptional regulator [Flavobacterium sp.]|uniref:helix-turn-helix transcriptional regulator n=1 Tax=Flavobacterium sp. TaxID=239 RepID=UPI003C4ADDDB